MNLRSFTVNRVYLDPLNMSNAGDFFLELKSQGFYSSLKRGRKIRRRMPTVSIKRQMRKFHAVVVQVDFKEMY